MPGGRNGRNAHGILNRMYKKYTHGRLEKSTQRKKYKLRKSIKMVGNYLIVNPKKMTKMHISKRPNPIEDVKKKPQF